MKFAKKYVLDTVQANADKHKAEYAEACEEYQAKLISVLEKAVGEAKDGSFKREYLSLPRPPPNHLKDYGNALAMLVHTSDQQIELSAETFAKYILDDWEWKGEFANVKSSYNMK